MTAKMNFTTETLRTPRTQRAHWPGTLSPYSVISVSLWWILSTAFAAAQELTGDSFADGKDGAKIHTASGLVCPAKIGPFERDAVGEYDPQSRADFCAYSALDGVYGTIRILPAGTGYDAKASLAHDFAEQEATGGKRIAEDIIRIAPQSSQPLAVYTRSYETAELEELHYRVVLTGAEVKNWAVETTIEYASPRDTEVETDFLHAVYQAVPREIIGQ